ncbi:MAG: hypothetical protein AAFQ14_13225 [Cyanobacteria bacterium J06621_12]
MATEYGYWFERQDNQAVRVQKIVNQGEEGRNMSSGFKRRCSRIFISGLQRAY